MITSPTPSSSPENFALPLDYDHHYYVTIAHRYLKNWEKANDIVQEAIARCLSKKATNPVGYLKLTIKNLCLNEMRRYEHRVAFLSCAEEQDDDDIVPIKLTDNTTPEMLYADAEMDAAIHSFVKGLPQAQKQAFSDYIFSDLSLRECALNRGCHYETYRRNYGTALVKWKARRKELI